MKNSITTGDSLRGTELYDSLIENEILSNNMYCGINFQELGYMHIFQAMPKIRKDEVNDFLYRTVKFYEYRLPNDVIAVLLRGAASADLVIDPSIYPDDRLSHLNDEECSISAMIQYDILKDKVTALRMIQTPEAVRKRLMEICNHNYELGLDRKSAFYTMKKYVYPFTPQELERSATYIGCEEKSVITKSIVFVG